MKSIPKEYILEDNPRYNMNKFYSHLNSVLTLCDINFLYRNNVKDNVTIHRLFRSFFKTKEHSEIAYDLLKYSMDIEENMPTEVIKSRFIHAMNNAGYFD